MSEPAREEAADLLEQFADQIRRNRECDVIIEASIVTPINVIDRGFGDVRIIREENRSTISIDTRQLPR
jgi:hypothetical protein